MSPDDALAAVEHEEPLDAKTEAWAAVNGYRVRNATYCPSTVASLLWTFGYLTAFLGLAIFFLFLGFGFVLLAATRVTLVWLSKRTGRNAADLRNVLIVGTGPEAAEARAKLRAHDLPRNVRESAMNTKARSEPDGLRAEYNFDYSKAVL